MFMGHRRPGAPPSSSSPEAPVVFSKQQSCRPPSPLRSRRKFSRFVLSAWARCSTHERNQRIVPAVSATVEGTSRLHVAPAAKGFSRVCAWSSQVQHS